MGAKEEVARKDTLQKIARLEYLHKNASDALEGQQETLCVEFLLEIYGGLMDLLPTLRGNNSLMPFSNEEIEALEAGRKNLQETDAANLNRETTAVHVIRTQKAIKMILRSTIGTEASVRSAWEMLLYVIEKRLKPLQYLEQRWFAHVRHALIAAVVIAGIASGLRYFFQRHEGLMGQYFLDDHLGDPYFVKRDRTVNFDWGTMGISGKYNNYFSIRWTGFLKVPTAGEYNFSLRVDDGGRLMIDGKMLLDDWKAHYARETTAAIHLDKGYHPITVEYFEKTGYASVLLSWKKPDDNSFSVIEPKYLVPRPEDLPEDSRPH